MTQVANEFTQAIAAAAAANDTTELFQISVDMGIWAQDERAWLAANPSEPCFAQLHSTYGRLVDALDASGDPLADVALGDSSALAEYQADMDEVNAAVRELVPLVQSASGLC